MSRKTLGVGNLDTECLFFCALDPVVNFGIGFARAFGAMPKSTTGLIPLVNFGIGFARAFGAMPKSTTGLTERALCAILLSGQMFVN